MTANHADDIKGGVRDITAAVDRHQNGVEALEQRLIQPNQGSDADPTPGCLRCVLLNSPSHGLTWGPNRSGAKNPRLRLRGSLEPRELYRDHLGPALRHEPVLKNCSVTKRQDCVTFRFN